MAENKRIAVKWIRDKAKAAYIKASECFVCGTTEELELHHLCSVTLLLESWAADKGYPIDTDEQVLAIRDEFIAAHHDELYNQVYTLCNPHHVRLHGIYGKIPPKHTAPKQRKWLQIQKDKANGIHVENTSPFAAFI